MQLLFRARRRHVKQPPLLFKIVKLILKTARRKPPVSHPDQKHIVPLEPLRRMHRRKRNETTVAANIAFLHGFGRIEVANAPMVAVTRFYGLNDVHGAAVEAATAADVERLVALIQQEVKRQFDVDLTPEFRTVGEPL